MRPRQTLDVATKRALAVEASTDPRTIDRVYRGLAVRGLAGHRARLVLSAAGFLRSDSPTDELGADEGHAEAERDEPKR
jgi:hypothetical protein